MGSAMGPITEFHFGFLYNEKTNYFPFDKLKKELKKLSEETNCKIQMHLIEVQKISEALNKIDKLDMLTTEPKDASHIPKILKKFPQLRWVHSMFAGVDKFLNLKEIKDNPGMVLTNARGAYADPLGEFCIMAMLYFNYNVPNYIELMEQQTWKKLTNTMLVGKKVCVIGYGMNGIAIAKRAKGLEMHVTGVVRENRENRNGVEYLDSILTFNDFKDNQDLIGSFDFVITTLPQTDLSNNFFDLKFFRMMKKDSIFINIGRGSAVVEADIITALNDEIIRGAVLDVCQHEPLPPDDPLYKLPKNKILITNHCGDFTTMYIDQSYKPLLDNIRSVVQGKGFATMVNKIEGY